ncbi:MAG TPA: hypothetical protein DD473_20405 [Planctomycetaceae bacterium]|nr:hypothetical protein [Planctomycetaceae bacterium]
MCEFNFQLISVTQLLPPIPSKTPVPSEEHSPPPFVTITESLPEFPETGSPDSRSENLKDSDRDGSVPTNECEPDEPFGLGYDVVTNNY